MLAHNIQPTVAGFVEQENGQAYLPRLLRATGNEISNHELRREADSVQAWTPNTDLQRLLHRVVATEKPA